MINEDAVNKYFIINLETMDYYKDDSGNIILIDTEEEAITTCGMYEWDNVLIAKGIYNHIE